MGMRDAEFSAQPRNVPAENKSSTPDTLNILTVNATDRSTVMERTSRCLANGGLIAMPTDTVYGLACLLSDHNAIRRVFEIKQRPIEKSLPVLLSAANHIHQVASMNDARIAEFALRYWPGPLTVVVAAQKHLPVGIVGSGNTVGVRIPDHPLAREVIERAGGCLAATSANRSGLSPARTAADVVNQLGSSIDLVIDDGSTGKSVASSVVAFSNERLVILREGAITASHLRATWQEIRRGLGND